MLMFCTLRGISKKALGVCAQHGQSNCPAFVSILPIYQNLWSFLILKFENPIKF
ncbi:hypothetical protein HHE03_07920 [Helicobacter heilmannii]|nr:hypothetical protein HHE03_07920 [Helicobacter heilmannii]